MMPSKIENNATKLADIAGIKIYRGVTTGYNPAFIISDEERDTLFIKDAKNKDVIKNLLQGRNIRKWYYKESNENIVQTGYDINIPDEYPSIYTHLLKYEEELVSRTDQGKNWWNLRACQYYPEFECCYKIIWGLTADKWAFALDTKKHYLPSNGYILTSTNIPIKYILGLLNSKLMNHYFTYIGVMTAGGAYTLKAATISALPFKIAKDTNEIEVVVQRILTIKENDHNADISSLEQQIDLLVYRLYDMTYDEILIIDPETPIVRDEYEVI